MAVYRDFERLAVIAPNFKRRLSGVTSTIIQLVPEQTRQGLAIATVGPGLPDHLPKLRYRDLWRLWKRPAHGGKRIWHARRNTEMIGGIIARDVLRMPLKLVFTSAAQRHHKPLTKWMIAQMDGVIATSAKSGAFLASPHTVIMHGIDTDRFVLPASKADAKQLLGLAPHRKIIGCTGRIRHSKGTDLLVNALIETLPMHENWDAVITGRATAEHAGFKQQLETRIADAGLSQRIRFVGEVYDVLPWYQAFDLFVAPSRHEGFGLTPLEAMSCGVPCVTSDAGSYAEMQPDTGQQLCVAADNQEDLTSAINLAIKTEINPLLVRNHIIGKFALEAEAQRINKCYRDLTGN